MKKADIYKGFKGYNAYPLVEAEKIIRSRILERFEPLIVQLGGCEQKARQKQMIWILEHIIALKRRMERMKKQIEKRDELFVPAYLKARITRVDEENLSAIDHRLAELIGENLAITEALSCAETDSRIVDKFSSISDHLREMETLCHERALLLKKEIL